MGHLFVRTKPAWDYDFTIGGADQRVAKRRISLLFLLHSALTPLVKSSKRDDYRILLLKYEHDYKVHEHLRNLYIRLTYKLRFSKGHPDMMFALEGEGVMEKLI